MADRLYRPSGEEPDFGEGEGVIIGEETYQVAGGDGDGFLTDARRLVVGKAVGTAWIPTIHDADFDALNPEVAKRIAEEDCTSRIGGAAVSLG